MDFPMAQFFTSRDERLIILGLNQMRESITSQCAEIASNYELKLMAIMLKKLLTNNRIQQNCFVLKSMSTWCP